MRRLNLYVALFAFLLTLEACGSRAASVAAGDTIARDIPPIEVSIYHVYSADECADWFSDAIVSLRQSGMDSLRVAAPGLFVGVSDEAKDVIDQELSGLGLPDNVCWSWIRYWNRDNSHHTWDMVVYDRNPLLTDSIYNAVEDKTVGGYHQIAWTFSDPSRFAEITRSHIGRPLALAINGRIVMAPTVNSEIESGNCAVGAMTRDELIEMISE